MSEGDCEGGGALMWVAYGLEVMIGISDLDDKYRLCISIISLVTVI